MSITGREILGMPYLCPKSLNIIRGLRLETVKLYPGKSGKVY